MANAKTFYYVYGDSLKHWDKGKEKPDHKYISREYKNGKWQYIYDHTFGRKEKVKELQEKIDYYDYLINNTLQEKIDFYTIKYNQYLKDNPDATSAYSENNMYAKQYADKIKELKDEQKDAEIKLEDLQKELDSYK